LTGRGSVRHAGRRLCFHRLAAGAFFHRAIIGGACIAGVAIFLAHIPVLTQEQAATIAAERAGA